MKKIAVFCGSSLGFSEIYQKEAQLLGEYFCKHSISMVYGGGKIGMMGAIANAMLKDNGEVIGVIPQFLRHEEVEHTDISMMHITKKMSKRKVKISKMVDGYIALAGGFGTLDEIFEALTLGQLGIESKPVGILNTNGFFNHLILQLEVMVIEGYLKKENKEMLIIGDSVDDLMSKMSNYQIPTKCKVTNKVAS
jgi:uncharacterized protein (TIGR00730 family)